MDADNEKTAKPRRRWLQFSLRTLLIVVTVLAVPLGWIGWELKQVRKERATITWVEDMGGSVNGQSWFGLGRVWGVTLGNTQVSDLSPLAKLKNLKGLWLNNTQVSDLSPLAELKNLVWLDLYNTQVSDLSPLAKLKNLTFLNLGDTHVSDLSPLAELKNFAYLVLTRTQVSDLSSLAELKNLQELDLSNTHVSDEQVKELQKALPGCDIHHSIRVEK